MESTNDQEQEDKNLFKQLFTLAIMNSANNPEGCNRHEMLLLLRKEEEFKNKLWPTQQNLPQTDLKEIAPDKSLQKPK